MGETSIDQVILPPSIVIRHNTADVAALLGTSVLPPIFRKGNEHRRRAQTYATNAESSRKTTQVRNGVEKVEERSMTSSPTQTELKTKEVAESSVNAKEKTAIVLRSSHCVCYTIILV